MEQTIQALINKLDPTMILMLAIGYGVWRLAQSAMLLFTSHADKIAISLDSIAKDTTELKKDIAVIAERVQSHENRLVNLERNDK